MKLIKIFFFILIAFNISTAKSNKFSTISLPQSYFLDISVDYCDIICIQDLLDNKLIFSFLSKYNDRDSTKTLQEHYLIYGQIFNVFLVDIDTGNIRFAILVPQKTIKSYALNSVNTAIAYLLTQSNEFEITVFNSIDETNSSIINTLNQIRQEGFSHILAPVTQIGARVLIENSDGLNIFIPTLHKSIFPHVPSNIVFGGIDYKAQIEALSQFSNEFLVVFSDDSQLSKSLELIIDEQDDTLVLDKTNFNEIKKNYKKYFYNNKNLNASTIYFNVPLVTTSLLASQTRVYKNKPFSMLSTQINYSPIFLNLTQPEDRVYFFIASSIGDIDTNLNSLNRILGQNIEYDWVNYSTSIGVEYLSTRFFNVDLKKLFSEKVIDSQVLYDTKIYRTGRAKFIPQSKDYDFFNERSKYFEINKERENLLIKNNVTKKTIDKTSNNNINDLEEDDLIIEDDEYSSQEF